MKKFNKCMDCLSIELTRRCNMNCAICGRGLAQNIDITKEIINKTLDEMEGVYINVLRINGGEPFLTPEMMEYLISEIVSRHIYINEVIIFTNGKCIHKSLIKSFQTMTKYLNETENEIKHIIRWYSNNTIKVYSSSVPAKFNIIISEYAHDSSAKEKDDFIRFYSQIDDADFRIIKQSIDFDNIGNLTLEGNALENFRQFIGNQVSLKDIRMLNNDYAFVDKCVDDFDLKSPININGLKIKKTLTVSANGNVFPGCIMSYNRVDNVPMFNIMDCNRDFFDKVVSFCWKHPINYKARNLRNKFLAIEFCLKHNITVEYMSQKDYALTKLLDVFASRQEEIAVDMHSMLPALWFEEIDAITTATLVLQMFDMDVPIGVIKEYLRMCSEFDSETIMNISPEWCRGFILFLSEKDRKRREKEEHN